MNKFRFVTAIAAAGLILGACSGKTDQKQKQNNSSGDHSAHANMKMESGEPTDESIYNVSSTWQNRYGHKVQLDSLRGKVQIVAMVYTHCEYACPRILADMQRIQRSLSEETRQNSNFVIISIDPERDTPERLRTFAKENNLSDEEWTLLHGNQGDILEIAALLGFKYKRISDTDFTHSNMITVLNREGEISHQRNQLTDNQMAIVKQIEQLATG